MTTDIDTARIFTEKARIASATVERVRTMQQALDYAADLCWRNGKKEGLAPPPAMAAPALSPADFAQLKNICDVRGINLFRENLRSNLQGIDVGVTYADLGIAETGSLVINSTSENLRLATMISDIHLAILPVSGLRADDRDIIADLRGYLAGPENYTTFITGPSRTADIERVLAIGVHGPLELHILLLEETQC
ncbi:MAG: lactate utilization protein [Desulfocapsaceae bacterium]|nr:lactate utilization protein [Desulfocapsaceae bacterium]